MPPQEDKEEGISVEDDFTAKIMAALDNDQLIHMVMERMREIEQEKKKAEMPTCT